jgi:hypothetical protein
MMPLSAPDAQVITLIRTPKLPESLFLNAQPVNVRVIASEGNQATILLAGRQLATQTTLPLTPGQTLSAQPMLINGQLQLKVLTPSQMFNAPQANINTTTTNLPSHSTLAITNATLTSTTNQSTPLPNWAQTLPNATKDALVALKTSLPNQLPLQQLLSMVNDQLKQASQGLKPINPAWQILLNQALNLQTPLTAESVQQTMKAFNDKYAKQPVADWKQGLINLLNDDDSSIEEKMIAQQLLNRSEVTQQLQNLQHNAGNAVWLQEIPLNTRQLLDNFTLEIDLPKTEQPESEQHWKVFIQINLPEGDFTSRIQMDKQHNLRVQLWGSSAELTLLIQSNVALLKQALTEQGLYIESIVVIQGKPEPRTEKPLWHQPLVDCHG